MLGDRDSKEVSVHGLSLTQGRGRDKDWLGKQEAVAGLVSLDDE